jgi:hypothetical protein
MKQQQRNTGEHKSSGLVHKLRRPVGKRLITELSILSQSLSMSSAPLLPYITESEGVLTNET